MTAMPNAFLPTAAAACAGAQLLEALENGVYEWPKLEGRFPQVGPPAAQAGSRHGMRRGGACCSHACWLESPADLGSHPLLPATCCV